MKAPDKIYILPTEMVRYYFTEERIQPAISYIRKDALLEWARKHQCEQGFEDGEAEHGYQSAIQDLIKHIESL